MDPNTLAELLRRVADGERSVEDAVSDLQHLPYEALLESCDFIIASRPGFRLDTLRLVIPPELLSRVASPDPNTIALRKTRVHLLSTVASHVSSTEIRQRLKHGQSIHGLVPPRVEEYILHQALYR